MDYPQIAAEKEGAVALLPGLQVVVEEGAEGTSREGSSYGGTYTLKAPSY